MNSEYSYTDDDVQEIQEWIEALDDVIERSTPERVRTLLRALQTRAHSAGIRLPFSANTPYINTIHADDEPTYPGNREIERRIKSIIRWNAMAMVIRANKHSPGIGGHISSYASIATLYEVGYNHFFRARDKKFGGDYVYFQGHSSPGTYARAFLEGRLTSEQLENFRAELEEGGGLSSYPHPWLMPDFWEFPTVSMGLGPLMAIYHARFIRYLEDRGLKEPLGSKVWCFVGDGETDEPECLGSISLPAREKLDNLIFVVNCNLQRLDGPVRGNGKIIQELEAIFRGAGWNVIKVIWGSHWDPLLEIDDADLLVNRMNECVDGQYQKYSVESGAYTREHFFGVHPELLEMVRHLSDDEIRKLGRGGHDANKVYAAYEAAVKHKGGPTVILAKTIKGYGLGESGEGKNITHQQKKLNEDELREFRTRFSIPIEDERVGQTPFYKPPENSPEMIYLHERREELGGYLPKRSTEFEPITMPPDDLFQEFHAGTKDREVSTTMAFVRILTKLLSDPEIGDLVAPIVPDEARTFGMEALFRQVGIYSHAGQLYEPVDSDHLLYYKEAENGQILEEGITEAGAMASFIAAGSAYYNHGVNTIPFFIYYSMFGMQRIGDLVWAAGDMRCRGFLVGGTSGRTTLAGEGLQHQDGHSHLAAISLPTLHAYDPAFAYELAVIVRDGIRRMYVEGEDIMYYITVANENYAMPPKPEGVDEGILRGLYRYKEGPQVLDRPKAHLFGSGAILNEAVRAQELLEGYGVSADVWSVTSYKELYRDSIDTARWNRLNPEADRKSSYLETCLADTDGVYVAASDFLKALPELVSRAFPRPPVVLGTDGFGRSDSREALRRFFEVDAESICVATLSALAGEGAISRDTVAAAMAEYGMASDKPNPAIS